MASIDELEAQAKVTAALTVTKVESPKKPNCDPCKEKPVVEVNHNSKICINCTYGGVAESHQKWKNEQGADEVMRYCFNFMQYVPARITFGCTLFEQTKVGG